MDILKITSVFFNFRALWRHVSLFFLLVWFVPFFHWKPNLLQVEIQPLRLIVEVALQKFEVIVTPPLCFTAVHQFHCQQNSLACTVKSFGGWFNVYLPSRFFIWLLGKKPFLHIFFQDQTIRIIPLLMWSGGCVICTNTRTHFLHETVLGFILTLGVHRSSGSYWRGPFPVMNWLLV